MLVIYFTPVAFKSLLMEICSWYCFFVSGNFNSRRSAGSFAHPNSSQASDEYVVTLSMLSYVQTSQLQPRIHQPAAYTYEVHTYK